MRPSPGINYDFVVIMYLVGSGIALLFFLLETQILAPLMEDDQTKNNTLGELNNQGESGGEEESPWKEFAKGMEGMHLIFIPFIPCLLWSLIVRYYWMKETKLAAKEKKEN